MRRARRNSSSATPRFTFSATDSDTVLVRTKPYRVYTPKTYTTKIFPALNKFHEPLRLSVNDMRGSRDYFVARLAETYLIRGEALLRDGRATRRSSTSTPAGRRAAIPGHETEMELTVASSASAELLNERALRAGR